MKFIFSFILVVMSFFVGVKVCADDYAALTDDNKSISPYNRTNLKAEIGLNNIVTILKVSSDGKVLPDSATSWACNYVEYKAFDGSIKKVLWEVKTDDESVRSMKWTYSWYDSNVTWLDNQNIPVHGYKLGQCLHNGELKPSLDCSTERYIQDINNLKLCGQSNWKLPSESELSSLVLCPNGHKKWSYAGVVYEDVGLQAINAFKCEDDSLEVQTFNQYFPNTYDDYKASHARKSYTGAPMYDPTLYSSSYWSTSAYAPITSARWFVNFRDGAKDNMGTSSTFAVRLIHDASNFDKAIAKKPCFTTEKITGFCDGKVYGKNALIPSDSTCLVYASDIKEIAGATYKCIDGNWSYVKSGSFCEIPDGIISQEPCVSKYISEGLVCMGPKTTHFSPLPPNLPPDPSYKCINKAWIKQ